MVSFFRPLFSGHSRRRITVILAFFWCFGLVFGALLAASTDVSRLYMMRAALNSCVSITGLVCSLLLPLLFSALAVYISKIWLLIPIVFGKAFLFSYFGTALGAVFPSSGWLLRSLLFFSDCFTAPVLIWLWLRLSDPRGKGPLRTFLSAAIPVLMIGCLDFLYISPYLSNLLSH